MYNTIKEAVNAGKAWGYEIIMEKDGMYAPAKWNEKKYIEECGGKYVGTIADLYKNQNN